MGNWLKDASDDKLHGIVAGYHESTPEHRAAKAELAHREWLKTESRHREVIQLQNVNIKQEAVYNNTRWYHGVWKWVIGIIAVVVGAVLTDVVRRWLLPPP